MEKLIVQTPFTHNGVYYHQGSEFRPRDAKDGEEMLRKGFVRRKTFARPGQPASAPAVAPRSLKVESAEEKLAAETTEKTAEESEESEDQKDDQDGKRSKPRASRRSRQNDE